MSIAGRYMVVDRNGSIPGEVESMARAAGTHRVQRHDRLGLAVVQGSASADAVGIKQLSRGGLRCV